MNATLLNNQIIKCKLCPRLLKYCASIAKEKRKSYQEWTYWGKPVPNFGDSNAEILIVGLAPAAHGANRTGRMFTGDRSGEWLYRALYKSGLANQTECTSIDDGLKLSNTIVTAVTHCAPPDNKPTPREICNCRPFLESTIKITQPKIFVALGAIAWNAILQYYITMGEKYNKKPKFGHLAEYRFSDGKILLGSYHPSQQNTFTGRLTEEMLDKVFARAKKVINQ